MGDSRLWGKLLEVREHAKETFIWELGEGQISFWLDRWTWNGEIIQGSTSIPNPHDMVKDYWNGNQCNYTLLYNILNSEQLHLVQQTPIYPDQRDKIVIKNANSQKISSFIYQTLFHWPSVHWGTDIWGKHLTTSTSFFSWRLWLSMLPTDDILKMKGLRGLSVYFLCLMEEETLDHLFLFFKCNFSQKVWTELLTKFKMDTMNLSWSNFYNCREEWKQINLQVIPCIDAWFIWMYRNSVKYEGSTPLAKVVTTHYTSYL
ncbi:uncharacterized protein LOC110024711 [Phalaenopsis equestris]|uniref:uncharacterized protein LOC110024711 n=1 Tax=Phalaenopsis equestris TaxID=78828 RepID=UPI0009E357B4|nr:uncharacterized protein LOC110024711 [Phalaenopsis equestris]